MGQLPHSSAALPLIALRENIRAQLKASRHIFEIVQRLAEVAQGTDDERIRNSLEQIMGDLLATGTDLSDDATDTGNRIIEFAKSQGEKERSEPA